MMELQFIFLYVYEEMWKVHLNILPTFLEALGKKTRKCQEGYIEELTRFPQCLNAKTSLDFNYVKPCLDLVQL